MNAGIPIIIQMAKWLCPQMGYASKKQRPTNPLFHDHIGWTRHKFLGFAGFAPFSDRSKWAKAVWEFANSVGECSGEAKDDELSHPTSRPRAAPLDFRHKAWTAAYGLRKELFEPLLMCSLPEDRVLQHRRCCYYDCQILSVHSDLKAMGVNKHVDTMIDSGTQASNHCSWWSISLDPRQTTSKWWDCLGTL